MGIKAKKWPSGRVCGNKYGMVGCTTIPFALGDTHGPKHVSKNKLCVSKYSRKIFKAIWSHSAPPQKTSFCSILSEICSEGASNPKFHHMLTFVVIKTEWGVVWPSRLLWKIAMDLGMSPNIITMSGSAPKNFLGRPKPKPLIHQHSLFDDFRLKMGIKAKKWPLDCVCDNKNGMVGRTTIPSALRDTHGLKHVCKNKPSDACKSTLEKFLRSFEATRLLPKRALFAAFNQKCCKKSSFGKEPSGFKWP